MLKDHLRLYKCLNENKVRYLIIGGVACGIYGSPRATLDIDIFIEPSLDNAVRLLKALENAGFGTASLTTPEKILANEINVFKDYLELDIFTRVKGIEFSKIWPKRQKIFIKGLGASVISINDLITSKIASKRIIDIEDIKILKKIKRLK
jgi:predicted nucleotidyltransferase